MSAADTGATAGLHRKLPPLWSKPDQGPSRESAGLLNTTTSASSIPGDPGPDSAGSANRWSKSATPLLPNADPGA